MDKVWLITSGEYSDYRVVGAYSTEEKANAALPFYTNQPGVEEYRLDLEIPHPVGWSMWAVTMAENGDTGNVWQMDPAPEGSQYWPGPKKRAFWVWGKDKQHAIKVANEKRIQVLAAGLWETVSLPALQTDDNQAGAAS